LIVILDFCEANHQFLAPKTLLMHDLRNTCANFYALTQSLAIFVNFCISWLRCIEYGND